MPLATEVMPAISILRMDNWIKNNAMKRCKPLCVHTSTVKKSAATTPPNAGSGTLSRLFLHSFEGRLNAVRFQDRCDRTAPELVFQIRECPFDAAVNPIAISVTRRTTKASISVTVRVVRASASHCHFSFERSI